MLGSMLGYPYLWKLPHEDYKGFRGLRLIGFRVYGYLKNTYDTLLFT